MRDIFEFWANLPDETTIHPADAAVFERLAGAYSFNVNCLPGPFKGPLRTAPVVLLFLSPGFEDADLDHAASQEGQRYYRDSRSGVCPLPSSSDHPGSHRWSKRIVRQFGVEYDDVREKVAFLNIGAYKSKSFEDWPLLSALPSCRTAVDWAQTVLFPEAEEGKRVVICLRSARHWGLQAGVSYAGKLFSPIHGRGGFLLRGEERAKIVAEVQAAVRG